LEKIVCDLIEVPSQHLPGSVEKTHEKPHNSQCSSQHSNVMPYEYRPAVLLHHHVIHLNCDILSESKKLKLGGEGEKSITPCFQEK
jgi:hypothetical protein